MRFEKGLAEEKGGARLGGLTGWLWQRFQRARQTRPRLALVEKIAIAPRQSLALVEAEGRRFLVATSAEGTPAFYPLHPAPDSRGAYAVRQSSRAARVSW